tara:strand:+ start:1886 stop:2620 length:735 start_codon:yes stop_codon:yes gene_type:complete
MTDTTDFTKSITEKDGQFCVTSDATGRGFGCYLDRGLAEKRLAQIERISKGFIDPLDDQQLISLHDGCHKATVTDDLIAVHDLIEDHLEHRGYAAPYTTGNCEQKLAAVSMNIPVIKAEDKFTLAPVYVPGLEDSDGEHIAAGDLQKSLWDWVRKGDRTIYLQHSEKAAGEMVELLTWPFEIETTLDVPGQGVTKYAFPEDTPFMGVIWEDWAWDMVKAGELRGYSIGGRAKRLEVDIPDMATV